MHSNDKGLCFLDKLHEIYYRKQKHLDETFLIYRKEEGKEQKREKKGLVQR